MKDYDLKTIKSAIFLRGYFFGKDLPEEARLHLDHLCNEIDTILTDVNQIVEADMRQEEMERERKRTERTMKTNIIIGTIPPIDPIIVAHEPRVTPADDKVTTENPTPSKSTGLEKKPRNPMSEEHKQKLRDSLAARRAAGQKLGRQPKDDAAPQTKPAPPRADTSPDVLISEHNEYVGERTDGVLADEDWPDIKKMRSNGLPDIRIAKSFGVTPEYLDDFIKKMMIRAPKGNW